MKRINIRKLKNHFNSNKKVYVLPIICLIIGTILGTTVSLLLTDEVSKPVIEYLNNFFSAYSLQGADKNEVFKASLHNNLKILILLWICGFSALLIPFLAFYVGLKGFKIGFAVSFLIKNFSYTGALLSATSMLTQAMIIVPFMIIYSGYSIRLTSKIKQIKENRMSANDKKNVILSNFTAVVSSVMILTLAAFVDCAVVPL